MIRLWRVVALTGYFGLFGLLLLWLAWLEPPARPPIALALILWVGPLLFPTRGLLNSRRYTHAWTSFLALFYFLFGVFHAAGPMMRPWLAWLDYRVQRAVVSGRGFLCSRRWATKHAGG